MRYISTCTPQMLANLCERVLATKECSRSKEYFKEHVELWEISRMSCIHSHLWNQCETEPVHYWRHNVLVQCKIVHRKIKEFPAYSTGLTMIKIFWTLLIYLRTREKMSLQSFQVLLVLQETSERACGRHENESKLPSDDLFDMLSYAAVVAKCIVARVGWLTEYPILCQFRGL